MAEKDDYDRAWERAVNARSDANQRDPRRRRIRKAYLVSGIILLGLGLVLAALGSETLAVYNACFADPVCYPSSSALPFGEFFGILAGGLVLSLVGAVQVAAGLRLSPKNPILSASL